MTDYRCFKAYIENSDRHGNHSLQTCYMLLPQHLKPYLKNLYPNYDLENSDCAMNQVCQACEYDELDNHLKVIRFWYGSSKMINLNSLFVDDRAWKTLYFDPTTEECLGIEKEEALAKLKEETTQERCTIEHNYVRKRQEEKLHRRENKSWEELANDAFEKGMKEKQRFPNIHFSNNHFNSAESYFRQSQLEASDNKEKSLYLAKEAMVLVEKNQYERAIKKANEALSLDSTNKIALEQRRKAQNELAEELSSNGKYYFERNIVRLGAFRYLEALETCTSDYENRYKLAWDAAIVLKSVRKFKKSLDAFDLAISCARDSSEKKKIIKQKNEAEQEIKKYRRIRRDFDYFNDKYQLYEFKNRFNDIPEKKTLEDLYDEVPDHIQRVLSDIFDINDKNARNFNQLTLDLAAYEQTTWHGIHEIKLVYLGKRDGRGIVNGRKVMLYFEAFTGKYLGQSREEAKNNARLWTEFFNLPLFQCVTEFIKIILAIVIILLLIIQSYLKRFSMKKLFAIGVVSLILAFYIIKYIYFAIISYLFPFLYSWFHVIFFTVVGFILIKFVLFALDIDVSVQSIGELIDNFKRNVSIKEKINETLIPLLSRSLKSIWSSLKKLNNSNVNFKLYDPKKRFERQWELSWSLLGKEEENKTLRNLRTMLNAELEISNISDERLIYASIRELVDLRISGNDNFNEGVRLQYEAYDAYILAKSEQNLAKLNEALNKFNMARREFVIGKESDARFQLCIDIVDKSIEEIKNFINCRLVK